MRNTWCMAERGPKRPEIGVCGTNMVYACTTHVLVVTRGPLRSRLVLQGDARLPTVAAIVLTIIAPVVAPMLEVAV